MITAAYVTGVQPTPNSAANMPAHSILASPPLSIPAGGTGVLKLNFKPTLANASYRATLSIYNTDSDEGTYKINLLGTAAAVIP